MGDPVNDGSRPQPAGLRHVLTVLSFLSFFILSLALLLTAPAAPVESSPPLQAATFTATRPSRFTNTPTRARPTSTSTARPTKTSTTQPTKTQRPTDTPGPTDTPRPTRTPKESTDTPWPADTPTEIPPLAKPTSQVLIPVTNTPTATTAPTRTPTTLPTDTPTTPPTDTPTLVPTLTSTTAPTLTATPTNPPLTAMHVVISEFRTSGPNGGNDQFVELYNPGQVAFDITGWKIKASDSATPPQVTTLLTITTPIILQPGAHVLAANTSASGYSGAARPDLTFTNRIPDDGGIALTTGNEQLVDVVGLGLNSAFKAGRPLAPLTSPLDASYERKLGGAAGSCVNTNDNTNDFQSRTPSEPQNLASLPNPCGGTPTPTVQAAAVATSVLAVNAPGSSGFASTWFVNNIRPPQAVAGSSIETLVRNALLAIILAILFGIFGLLLYDTLEANEEQVKSMLGPLRRWLAGAGKFQDELNEKAAHYHLRWLLDTFELVLALIAFGILYSLVDPSFDLSSPNAVGTFLAVTLSVGLVNLLDDLARLAYVRSRGGNAAVRVHFGNLLIAAPLVLVSRLGALSPGIMSVGVGGFEGEEKGPAHHLSLAGAAGYAVPAIVAWLLLLAFPAQSTGLTLWVATLLSLIFAIALQTVFFEMIPIPGFYGQAIFKQNRIVWFALFALFGFMFLQTQLDPTGSFVSTFDKPNMVALTIFVIAFGAFSVAVWLYFQRKNKE